MPLATPPQPSSRHVFEWRQKHADYSRCLCASRLRIKNKNIFIALFPRPADLKLKHFLEQHLNDLRAARQLAAQQVFIDFYLKHRGNNVPNYLVIVYLLFKAAIPRGV